MQNSQCRFIYFMKTPFQLIFSLLETLVRMSNSQYFGVHSVCSIGLAHVGMFANSHSGRERFPDNRALKLRVAAKHNTYSAVSLGLFLL